MAKDSKKQQADLLQVTDEVLANVINLARLDPLQPGMSLQIEHLKRILEHFKVLSQVELEGLDATMQINPAHLPLRLDEANDTLTREEALANARLRTAEFFLAPTPLGGEDS